METTTSILIAVILLILTFFLYNVLFGGSNYWTSRGIPCVPWALPIFGNTSSLFRSKVNLALWCREIYEKNPDKSMIGFYDMTKPTLLLRNPELVKIVLQSSFNNFQYNGDILDINVDPLIGRDIFFLRGRAWKEARPIFASAFSIKKLKSMCLTIENVCEKLDDYLSRKIGTEDPMELEVKMLFSRYTAEVAAGTVFSIDGHSFADDYRDTLLNAMIITMDPAKKKTLTNSGPFSLPFLNKVVDSSFVPPKVDRYFRKVASDVEELRKRDENPRTDVLQLMLDYVKDKKISREEAVAHAFTFFLESYETSSLTLSYVFYSLAKNPTIQDHLRKDIYRIMTKYEGRLTYEAIHEMNYMDQVISETLRLFPPVGYLSKVCSEKCRLEGPDGLSLEVEPDTSILISVPGLHSDPEIWDNPKKFDPERFSKDNIGNRHKFAYLPFGEGPRQCPGTRLGIMQVKAAIATILRKYRITQSSKMIEPLVIDPSYFMLTALGGFWVQLELLKTD